MMASMDKGNLDDEGSPQPDHSSGGTSGDHAETGAVVGEIFTPVNLFLLALCAFLLYQIIKGRRAQQAGQQAEAPLKPMKKRDFTLEQLRQYNGAATDGIDNRILIAVNGKVFDVTKGKKHYAPGGPYGVFAGRDASRGLGTFSLTDDSIRDTYDDLSDLKSEQMESIREWEEQFTEKYDLVGRLLKPGEEGTDYSDMEDESHNLPTNPHDKTKSD